MSVWGFQAVQGSLKRGFSSEVLKRKRQALDPESLQQRVSGLLGRPIDSLSLFKIMPYIPGAPDNIYSGVSLPEALPSNTTKP